MANVRVPSMLRPTVGGERVVAAEGSTLRELIENVDRQHPGFAGQLVENGTQRRFVNIYVNDEDVRYLQGLETPVAAGDVVSILPENVSIERRQLLEVYGAALEFTPAELGSNGAIRRAQELVKQQPERFYMLYQYGNPANPEAHFESTAPEILRDLPDITHFVA